MAQYQGKAQPVGDPADWIEPVFFDGWWVQTEPNTIPAPQANLPPAVAFIGEPDDFFEAAFDTFGWEQPTQEPVEHVEQYFTLPAAFAQIDPDDFVEAAFDTFGWEQPTQEPIDRAEEIRFKIPSVFFEFEPGDLVEPVFFDAWYRQDPPIISIPEYPEQISISHTIAEEDFAAVFETFGWERQTDLPRPTVFDHAHAQEWTFHIIAEEDFIPPFATFGWERQTDLPRATVFDARHAQEWTFAPSWETAIAIPDLVNFVGWNPPTQQRHFPGVVYFTIQSVFAVPLTGANPVGGAILNVTVVASRNSVDPVGSMNSVSVTGSRNRVDI